MVLFDPKVELWLVLPHQAKVDMGGMAIDGYYLFSKAPGLKPQHKMV